MNVDLICPYSKPIIQQHPVGATMKNDVSITCMTVVNPCAGWFDIVKVTMFELNEVTVVND